MNVYFQRAGGKIVGYSSQPQPADPTFDTVPSDQAGAEFAAWQLAQAIVAKQAAIATYSAARLSAGYADAGSGKRFGVTTDDRGDLTALVTFAQLCLGGAGVWGAPWNAKQALDGSALVFATPAAAVGFATTIGAWYGNTVQHAAGLKAQVAALPSIAAVQAFDITQGWP
jgi:hypothetical protein